MASPCDIVTPQPLRLWGIVITRGERVGVRAGGADACKRDNFITPRLRAFIFLPHVHDTNLKVKFDIQ